MKFRIGYFRGGRVNNGTDNKYKCVTTLARFKWCIVIVADSTGRSGGGRTNCLQRLSTVCDFKMNMNQVPQRITTRFEIGSDIDKQETSQRLPIIIYTVYERGVSGGL